eukprot:CAMPEP_0171191052 /NCGR_PEP_ID=MMETSP0790-20130122/19167_1 /TAXON_ID=2925 /ORGANISM="Alexandrium catenella, Strain OF101" /LENGTH=349 /DNA_ID=CAMNT_0011656191 /DNA_START=13 /DNA_END=1062 /DNA_ORIENTATION=+
MGGIASVKVNPNCESIHEPGKRSAVSDPIGKSVYVDFEDFFQECVAHSQTPILPWDLFFVKDVWYKDLGENVSESKVILCGKRLKMAGKQDTDEDKVSCWYETTVDPVGRSIVSEELVGERQRKSMQYSYFHYDEAEETFQVECWVEMPDGERRCGAEWAKIVEWFYLKPHIITRHLSKKVDCKALQPAPHRPELKVVLSQDMSEHYSDPEVLANGLVNLYKMEALDAGGQIEYGLEGRVIMDYAVDVAGNKLPVKKNMLVDMDNLRVEVEISLKNPDPDGEPLRLMTQYNQVYRDPPRVGYWIRRPDSDQELGSLMEMLDIGMRLNKLVNERDVMKQVDSLDEGSFFY